MWIMVPSHRVWIAVKTWADFMSFPISFDECLIDGRSMKHAIGGCQSNKANTRKLVYRATLFFQHSLLTTLSTCATIDTTSKIEVDELNLGRPPSRRSCFYSRIDWMLSTFFEGCLWLTAWILFIDRQFNSIEHNTCRTYSIDNLFVILRCSDPL